jgi:hypothetical protein
MIDPHSVGRKRVIEIGNIQSGSGFRDFLHRIFLYGRRIFRGGSHVKTAACH